MLGFDWHVQMNVKAYFKGPNYAHMVKAYKTVTKSVQHFIYMYYDKDCNYLIK